MTEENLLTKGEIWDIIAEAEEKLYHTDPPEWEMLLEQAANRYPGLNRNSPEWELIARRALTPLALRHRENLRRLAEQTTD